MTKPGEPRVRINPSEVERAEIKEWLEVEEVEEVVRIWHMEGGKVRGTLLLARRDLCALADWVAFQLWKPEDDEAEEHETIPATDEPQSLGDA